MRKNYLALSTEIPLHYHMNRIPRDGTDDEGDEQEETKPLNPAAEEQTNDEEGQSTQRRNSGQSGGYTYSRRAVRDANCINMSCAWLRWWVCDGCGIFVGNCKRACTEICGTCQLDNLECNCDCDCEQCCPT